MEKHSFYFKQFAVRHDRSAMKVGTDSVLLGAWVTVTHAKTVLDIGSGSGVIALMLAQRTPALTQIDAVEFSEADAGQARENAARSPWPERIHIIQARIQDYVTDHLYDLIVSNPPYFPNGSLPPSASRQQARHTNTLSFSELVESAERLLKPAGIFAVVLPVSEGELVKSIAAGHGLQVSRELALFSRRGKSQERWLFEFSRIREDKISETLIVHDEGNSWSSGYKALLKEFYLHI